MASTKLGLESLQNNAANQTLANLNFALLNQLVQAAVLDKDLATPPSSPANESLYIVATSATGAWAGQDGKLAYWLSDANAWTFIAPRAGYSVRVLDETEASGLPLVYGYTGSAWTKRDSSGGGGDVGMDNPMTTEGDLIVGGSAGSPARLAKGTDGQVLKMVSGSPAWGTDESGGSGGGGLTYWSDARSVAAPNAEVPAHSLVAKGDESSIDAALVPKGQGGLLAAVPDNGVKGGNKRGLYAVDLQLYRSDRTQIAKGDYSVALGGGNNTSGGNYSATLGGYGNIASGQYAVAMGAYSTASGTNSLAIGNSCTASGNYSLALGVQASATGLQSIALGHQSEVSGTNSQAYGFANIADGTSSRAAGQYANARGITGADVYATGRFSVAGDSQRGRYLLRALSTDTTAIRLTTDGADASPTNQVKLPDNSSYLVTGRLNARSSADAAAWEFKCLIRRQSGAASCALVGSTTINPLASSSGASEWALAISADTSNGALGIAVTGAASTSIKWLADVETVELVG